MTISVLSVCFAQERLFYNLLVLITTLAQSESTEKQQSFPACLQFSNWSQTGATFHLPFLWGWQNEILHCPISSASVLVRNSHLTNTFALKMGGIKQQSSIYLAKERYPHQDKYYWSRYLSLLLLSLNASLPMHTIRFTLYPSPYIYETFFPHIGWVTIYSYLQNRTFTPHSGWNFTHGLKIFSVEFVAIFKSYFFTDSMDKSRHCIAQKLKFWFFIHQQYIGNFSPSAYGKG